MLAGVAAPARGGAAVLLPAAPAAPPRKGAPEARPGAGDRPPPQSIFAGTAIGAVLEANGNEVPRSGEEMMRVLKSLGEFAQLPVTFSAVDLHTSLDRPRVVLAQRPSFARPAEDGPQPDAKPAAPFGRFRVPGLGDGPVQAPISTGPLTKPNLEGRLFLAANFEQKEGALRVKSFEFISWNGRKQRFDFGFIECDDVEPQIRVVDGVKCFSCHKSRGPILGQGPWSNTPHNDVLRAAVATSVKVDLRQLCLPRTIGQPSRLDAGFDVGIVRRRDSASDGLSLVIPQGPAVDAAVRLGADLARDRDVYRAMLRTPSGRKAAAVLLAAIASAGPLEKANHDARIALDRTFSAYPLFAGRWVTLHKDSLNTLLDFSPSGSTGSLKLVTTSSSAGWGGGSTLQSNLQIVWGGTSEQVSAYDAKRAAGEHGLPSNRQPSNPKAFVRPTAPLPPKPSGAVSATALARLIGLTEGDRAFLTNCLTNAADQVGKPKVTAAALAKQVFAGPEFAELLEAREIPDREDFKDRFVKSLGAVLKGYGAGELKLARADYASGPNVSPVPGKEEPEAPVVATTGCVRCHDVRGPGRPAFSPIPMLAFDPFDKDGREKWAKFTAAKARQPVLAKLLKRIADDRDMPPEDSAEYEAFRTKDSAALDAVRAWAEAELKKAMGG
jgi:hypothetical protein